MKRSKGNNASDADCGSGVGYGRPPEEHRFKRGKSGNPRGRPKKSNKPPTDLVVQSLNRELLAMMRRTRSVKVDGKRVEMSTQAIPDRETVKGFAVLKLVDKPIPEASRVHADLPLLNRPRADDLDGVFGEVGEDVGRMRDRVGNRDFVPTTPVHLRLEISLRAHPFRENLHLLALFHLFGLRDGRENELQSAKIARASEVDRSL